MRTYFTLPPDPQQWLCLAYTVVCDGCGSRTAPCACPRLHVTVQTPACARCLTPNGTPIPQPQEDAR